MDTKLLQKIAIGLICLSVLVIIGLTVFQHQLLKKMSQDPNQGTAVTSESTGGAVSGPDEAYRERLSEREIVTMFTESLSPDNKLTEAQQQDLVDAMYQERKNVYSQQGPAGDRPTFTSEYNDERISATMNMVDRTYDGYVRSAGAALSPSQLEQFKTYLKNQRDMTESALKLEVQIYGGQTTQESGDKESK